MKIVKIQINEFGPLKDRSFDFGETLTVIRGENESGKSSLLLFIKFALYGLTKRAKSGAIAETDRAITRDGAKASGYMIVSCDKKLYRIDRYISKGAKNFTERVQLTDIETGEKCDYGNSPGEFLLGISADIFENSCLISQLGCSTLKGEQTGTAIRNMLSSADESIDHEKALKILDIVRVKYLHKNKTGGSIYALEQEVSDLNARYKKAVDNNCETERLEADVRNLEDTIKDVSEKQRLAEELTSMINLRTAIKLFDKLHELEGENSTAKAALEALNLKLSKNGNLLDRSYVAELSGVKSELYIAHIERTAKKKELDALLASQDTEAAETTERLEKAGGLDALRTFAKKTGASIKVKTAFAITFAIVTVILAALPFIPALLPASFLVPSLAGAAVSLGLGILMLVLRKKSVSALKEKCNELCIKNGDVTAFIKHAEECIKKVTESDMLVRELRETLSIKDRVLDSAAEKCRNILKKYLAESDSSIALDKLFSVLDDTVASLTSTCDERDSLTSRIASLEARIKDLSGELADYNEHQIRHKVSEEILSMTEEEIRAAKKDKSFLDLQLKALGDKKLTAERALLERKYSTEDPFGIAAKLEKSKAKLEAQHERHAALVLAIETLEAASANLRSTIAPKLRASSNDYMARLTGGKYDSVAVTDALELSMAEDGFSYPIDTFSAGTKDAAYLALRLSLLDLLPSDETPPLLLDETLAMIDDKRGVNILSMLKEHSKERGQCILFCCHDREERLCRDNGIEFSSITM